MRSLGYFVNGGSCMAQQGKGCVERVNGDGLDLNFLPPAGNPEPGNQHSCKKTVARVDQP